MPADELSTGLATGVLAGLALTLPFGALAALLLDTAMRSTRTVAVSAAAGVAMTDFTFALVAAGTGAAVTAALEPWADYVRLASAAIILGLGVQALQAARHPDGAVGGIGLGGSPLGRSRPHGTVMLTERVAARRALVRFVAVTAANPLTTLTLTAMAAGLTEPGVVVCLGFALGCGMVSACWHGALALAGQAAGSRLGVGARSVAAYAGAGLTIAMAVQLALVG